MTSFLYAYYDGEDSKEGALPFWIGCGSKGRPESHLGRGFRGGKHWNPYMAEVLLSHENRRIIPRIEILATFEDSVEAREWERDLVDYYGRRCDGSGCLCNLQRGGGGSRPEDMTKEIKKKISDAAKKMFKDKSFKEAFCKAAFESWHTKGTRERHLAGLVKANAKQSSEFRMDIQLKSYAENPERKLKASIAAKEVNSRPGVRESKSAKCKEANLKSWADPEIRARRVAGMRNRKRKIAQE